MALIGEEKQAGMYFTISSGAISYTSTSEDPKAVAVKYLDRDNNEKVTYKVRVPDISGVVKNIFHSSSKFGDRLEIVIQNGIEFGTLQIKIDSPQYNYIVNMLMNVKSFDSPIKFSAWSYNDKTYLGLEQDGKKIPLKNTKDHSDAPQPKQVEKRGKTTWDFSEVDDYYYDYVENTLTKMFGDGEPKLDTPKTEATVEEDSGLPF